MLPLRVVIFASLAFALAAQELDLSDALDDAGPTKPPIKPAVEKPKEPSNELDLGDALGGGETYPQPTKPAAKPPPRDKGNSDFDLSDAVGGGDSQPKDPDRKPVPGGTNTDSGGDFGLDDLKDSVDGGYKPDDNQGGSAGGSSDTNAGGEVQGAGSGQLAGIISAVGVAVLGAASSYFAYQKKKLCFKVQGGGAENVNQTNQHGNQSDPQLFSNLLKQSP
ncbi:CD99 antigen isoform X2 [Huso huso]|uniref:CD99 antigen isoform X2 n=1 Tax=Huso huso TaxID=61971 RepID=A0ABR0ZL45_HUSHU